MSDLPAPPVPADVDLRGAPIPREEFARMAVMQFGIPIEVARSFVGEVADKIERKRARQQARRRR